MRAYTDEVSDMSKEHGVSVELFITPSSRRGVLVVKMAAYPEREGSTLTWAASYEREYPSAAVQSFEACLFMCSVRLERILRDRKAYPMGKA